MAMKSFTAVAMLAVPMGISFLFALAGEPQSLWLWRDVLGLM